MAPGRLHVQNGKKNGRGPNGNGGQNGNGSHNGDGTGIAATPVMVAPHLEVRESTIHGLGLFASRTIRKGMLIGLYEGPRTRRNGSYVLWMEDDSGRAYGINGKNALRYTPHFAVTTEELELIVESIRDAIENGPRK